MVGDNQMIETILAITGLIIGYIIAYKINSSKLKLLEEELKKYKFGIKSAYVKFGKTFEQFAPFTNRFTDEDKSNFKFLGQPIDGIIFNPEGIKFIDIKTGSSQLSNKQEHIKKLIQEGKVSFEEVRF